MPRAETVTLWMERLQRFEQSQMTVAQFCAAESVSQSVATPTRSETLEAKKVPDTFSCPTINGFARASWAKSVGEN